MFRKRPDPREHEPIVREALARLPKVETPAAIWTSIEAALDAQAAPQRPRAMRWVFACAALTVLVLATVTYFRAGRGIRWQVIQTTGTLSQTAMIGVGDWLQTGASTHAEIQVGTIGTVKIEPGSRLRIVATQPNEHRLLLDHGEISATISAPPKLFFVETKSATAVDLGCEYKMKVDGDGNGLLHVTRGWVAFDWRGRESLVPAGASCRTRAGKGQGTPYFDDASAALAAALDDFDFSGGGDAAVRAILNAARTRDTLTLWHLLARVSPEQRGLVYERMISFAAPPAGVSRDRVLALDSQVLKIWKDELAWTW